MLTKGASTLNNAACRGNELVGGVAVIMGAGAWGVIGVGWRSLGGRGLTLDIRPVVHGWFLASDCYNEFRKPHIRISVKEHRRNKNLKYQVRRVPFVGHRMNRRLSHARGQNLFPYPVSPVHLVQVLWPFPFAKIRANS